jgi:hypothetical protein
VAERDAVAIDDGGALDLVGRDQADILVGFQAELEIVILLGLAAEIGGSTGGGEAERGGADPELVPVPDGLSPRSPRTAGAQARVTRC